MALEPVMNMHRWSTTTAGGTSGKWSDLPGPTPYARERPLTPGRGAAPARSVREEAAAARAARRGLQPCDLHRGLGLEHVLVDQLVVGHGAMACQQGLVGLGFEGEV